MLKGLKKKSFRLLSVAALSMLALGLALVLLQRGGRPAQADTVGTFDYRPPLYEQLSVKSNQFGAAVDIEVNENVIVAVWTEGDPASGTTSNPNGNVELKYKWGNGQWVWRTVWDYTALSGKAYDDAVALDGDVAHIVWVVETAVPHYVVYYLGWNLRTNTCAKEPNLSPASCRENVSKDNTHSKTHPSIAVDANGVPHVVWAEQIEREWRIFYDNRNGSGGTWYDSLGDRDEQISSLSFGYHVFDHVRPVIAADDRYVYVAWDLDDRDTTHCSDNRSGIRFRLRQAITGTASLTNPSLWDPSSNLEAKRLSEMDGLCDTKLYSWPTIDVNQGHAYVMWQYLRDQALLGTYNVYTFSLQYRVFVERTATDQVWWPTIATGEYETPDEMAWDFPSLYLDAGEHAYYSGLRPSIELVGSGGVITPYVTWHSWTPPSSGGGGETSLESLDAGVSADEIYVTDEWPYRAYYAYARYGIPGNLGSIIWIDHPITVTLGRTDSVFCWPDMALASYDGGQTYYPHFALHRRASDVDLIKSVWYTNLDASDWVYLPAVFRTHSAH